LPKILTIYKQNEVTFFYSTTPIKQQMTNLEIIAAIQQSGATRSKALQQVYGDDKLRRTVVSYITQNGGSFQDAEDVFQDTVVLFDRQIRENQFQGQSNWATYFVGIAKWRWVSLKRKFSRDSAELKPEYHDAPVESVEARVIEGEKRTVIDEVLSKIGARCQQSLHLYKLSHSMEEIAEAMNLSSPEMAKKIAYECRKKFKEFVLGNPEYKAVLTI
jgi:RNA polymerase sigma factor (sigma-70 family)